MQAISQWHLYCLLAFLNTCMCFLQFSQLEKYSLHKYTLSLGAPEAQIAIVNIRALVFFFSVSSQPLVPRENITAWMNAIGLIITALPVSQSVVF